MEISLQVWVHKALIRCEVCMCWHENYLRIRKPWGLVSVLLEALLSLEVCSTCVHLSFLFCVGRQLLLFFAEIRSNVRVSEAEHGGRYL